MKKILISLFCLILVALPLSADEIQNARVTVKDREGDAVPDLYIWQFLSDHKTPVHVNDSITLDCAAILENIGETGWSAQIKMNGVVIKDTNGFNVSMAGHGVWVEYKVTQPGAHVAECILDSKNEVAESDERNNRKRITFKVEDTPVLKKVDNTGVSVLKPILRKPDLAVDGVRVKPVKDVPLVGGTETKIDCIYHRMGVEPSPFKIVLLVDSKPVGEKLVEAFRAAGSKVQFSSGWKAARGIHTIKCVIDPENKVKELNERNNTRSISVKVR